MISNFFLKRKAKKILSQSYAFFDDVESKKFITPLIGLLRDRNNDIRIKAVQVLGNISDKKAVDPLIRVLLNDKDTHLRNEAAKALAKIGDKRAIDVLIGSLTQDSPDIARALYELGWRPNTEETWYNFSFAITFADNECILINCDDVINFLIKLNTPQATERLIDVFIRISSVSKNRYTEDEDRKKYEQMIRGKLKKYLITLGASQVDILIKKWMNLEVPREYDSNGAPSVDLLIIIKEIFTKDSMLPEKLDQNDLTAIIEKLMLWPDKYENWSNKEEELLRILITEYPDVQYLTMFKKYLNDKNTKIQTATIMGLTRKDAIICKLLIEKYTFETNLDIKKSIIEAFGIVGEKGAISFLIDILKSKEVWIRGTVITALGKIGCIKAVPILAELVRDKNHKDDSIIEALINIGTPEVIEPLMDALKDEWYVPCVLEELERSKGNFQMPADAIVPLLKNETREVRELAASLLAYYGYSPSELDEKVVFCIANEQWTDLKKYVEEYGPSLAQVLLPYVDYEDSQIREEVIRALTIIKDENILRQVIREALKNGSLFITQFIDDKYNSSTKEGVLKDIGAYDEYLLMKGEARACSLCKVIGIKGPWNLESGNDILQEVSRMFYHVIKKLPNEWMVWKCCTLRSGDEFYYNDPQFYCASCSIKIQKWVADYGEKIANLFWSSSYPSNKEPLRKIGYKLYEFGGHDLMMMAFYYAVYHIRLREHDYPGLSRELDYAWNGIGGWQA